MCILKVYSKTKSFKSFSKVTKIPLYSIYEKGDLINKSKKHFREDYRISFDVSEKEWDNLDGQIEDAVFFLKKHYEELKNFLFDPHITAAYLDFPIYSRLDENIVNHNQHLPKELIVIAGELLLGIEIGIYSKNAFEGFDE